MGNPTRARRLNMYTVVDKNGYLRFDFNPSAVAPRLIETDPNTGVQTATAALGWLDFNKVLASENVLNIGSRAELNAAIGEADEFYTASDLEWQKSQLQKRASWSMNDTQGYVNDLYNRLINDPIIAAEMDTTVNKEKWEVAIVNSIMENLLAPIDPEYLTDTDRFSETIGENYLDELLIKEFNFLTNQGKQDAKYLFSNFRVGTTISEMNKEGWVDDEFYASTLGFDKLLAKENRIGFDALLPEEQEVFRFVSNMYATDRERMQLISDENSGSSYEKITRSVLKSVSEEDKLNNKNDAKIFPLPFSESQKQNEEARIEREFNLWNESAGLEKAIKNVDPTRFTDPNGNNIEQGILNNALADVQNYLTEFRIRITNENPGLSSDEVKRLTFDQYQRMIAEPETSYFDQVLQGRPQKKAIIDSFTDGARFKYAKNNPGSYVGLKLTQAGILPKEISQEIKDEWNRTIPLFLNIDQIDNFIGDNVVLQNHALAAKNQALADNKETLKAMAQSFLGITSATSEELLNQLSGKNKAVDQIADMFSAHYSTNPYERRSTEEIFNEFKKVYGLTPSGTFVKKRPVEEGFYSNVPGSFVSQGDEILASADDPNLLPTGYFDAAVMKAREAIEDLDPMEQAREQIDESRPPQFAVESAFGVPAFRRVAPTAPVTDEDILKNLQASYADRPEFLKFLLPNIEMLKKEFYKTQTPTQEQLGSAVDMFSKQQMAKQFEKTKPENIGNFLSAGLPGDLEQQFKFTNLFKQQEERLANEQKAVEELEERERRRQLISQPVTIFGRRRR